MLAFETWDVFTESPFAGNPLAIVRGADALSVAQMQTLAREFNLSETLFVMAPRDPARTARVRIFFPTAEIPFAGHPTLGCAIALSGLAAPGPDAEVTLVLEEEAGLVPVCVRRRANRVEGTFAAPVLPFAAPGRADPALTAAALGVATLGTVGHPAPSLWQGGPAFLYVPLPDLATLAAAGPVQPHWSRLMHEAGVDSAWCYTRTAQGYRARMFSPTAGIPEDPATGSASAIFAAELMARGLLGAGETRIAIAQGIEMGRPSTIGLTAVVENGALAAVRVTGSAVPIAQGRIAVPQVAG
ncbi:MAG: PhzF family phenazine biosynthesis protein [Rhodobacter sp.]|uniref:PhzF family phenazine biosynthesis protein n=1 Tax=Pararhodobacter sp. TaxID=2127056 RepID=UPI001D3D9822|nr:PhzF family phenazine biosynthesis protein [Pararhodobacter sp.]MCB1346545.1 PhzF family phenazine biosynthesis protein [Paracoccaceae bacterium]MCC0073000.1 PhzF family phenazine biosynthesis protein [Rhodobacter sp.]HPD93031.1 PhzF family phenazine biosynthesis protein [Pararhodobacter sp.]